MNELRARDVDGNAGTAGGDEYIPAYDADGNMTDDSRRYEYVYDAFGRLRQVKNTSNQALLTEYRYNGPGHRIAYGTGTVYYFCYDEE